MAQCCRRRCAHVTSWLVRETVERVAERRVASGLRLRTGSDSEDGGPYRAEGGREFGKRPPARVGRIGGRSVRPYCVGGRHRCHHDGRWACLHHRSEPGADSLVMAGGRDRRHTQPRSVICIGVTPASAGTHGRRRRAHQIAGERGRLCACDHHHDQECCHSCHWTGKGLCNSDAASLRIVSAEIGSVTGRSQRSIRDFPVAPENFHSGRRAVIMIASAT